MKKLLLPLLVFIFWLRPAGAADATPAPVLLISMDALRWDYRDKHPDVTPNLRQLAREGASLRELIPVFPSNTFPNHYSIVTGLYPAHSGIVNNTMFDPPSGRFFRYNTAQSSRESMWWGGEPVWITAVKQGRASACSYWPGSEAEIEGTHATYWKPYNYYDVTFESRLDELVAWLRKPAAERPAVVAFYFEETNTAGHEYGPDSKELIDALKLLDTRLGALRERLARENLPVNLVLVSDHGMTPALRSSAMILDDYVDSKTVQVESDGSIMMLRPLQGDAATLAKALEKMPHAKVYTAETLPARFHLTGNPRISPVWIVPDPGWHAYTRTVFQAPEKKPLVADHGYDPEFRDMHATMIVQGPAFRHDGAVLPPAENVNIYNLLCAAAGLKPAPNDGDDRLVKAFMAK